MPDTAERKGKIMKKRKMMTIALMAAAMSVYFTGCLGGRSDGEDSVYEGTTGKAGAEGSAPEMAVQETAAASQIGGPAMISESIAVIDGYAPVPGNDFGAGEEYNSIQENGFLSVREYPLSTFSADVDTASYSNIRRMINRGEEIPEDAVRIEEMINYFSYDYEQPQGEEPLAVTAELSDCPWNEDSQLLLLGIQGKAVDFEDRPMSNLVFLLDVSGSMYSLDKLPLVQKSFGLLIDELTENDRVSIVTYAGYEQVLLEGVTGDHKAQIREAIDSLQAGGSTAGEAGINRAYEIGEKYFIQGGNNRVILATDGDLNVGVSSEEELTKLIEEKRESGIHLSVLGFGTGNIKDNKLEALADNGDGNYAYIDSLMEAKKVLADEMGGTLLTIAKDVKIQVEFNPAQVAGYRLIGYENRALADEDFADDSVDAGEIGSGHRVTVLYELIRDEEKMPQQELKYQSKEGSEDAREGKDTGVEGREKPYGDELLTMSIRYKEPDGDESRLMSVPVKEDIYNAGMSPNMIWAGAVAETGMILRDSRYKGTSDWESVLDLIGSMPESSMDDYRDDFRLLVLKVSDR